MWSATEYPIHRAVADFHEALSSSSVALRRLHDHYSDEEIAKVAQHEKARLLEEFMKRNSNLEETVRERLLEGLCKRLDIHIGRYLERNQSNRMQSENANDVTEKFIDFQIKNFKSSVKMHLSVNPAMEMEDFDELLKREREISTGVILKMEERMRSQEKDLREKHKKFLKGGMELLGQVKSEMLKMSRFLIVNANNIKKTNGSIGDLEVIVEDIRNHLLGKGNRLKECNPSIYDKLLGVLNGAVKFILEKEELRRNEPVYKCKRSCSNENKGILLESLVPWARKLDRDLKECFMNPKKNPMPTLKRKSTKNASAIPITNHVMTRLRPRRKAGMMDSTACETQSLLSKSDSEPSNVNMNEDNELPGEIGLNRSRSQDLEMPCGIVNPSISKRFKLYNPDCSCQNFGTIIPSVKELNVPDEGGFVPLFRAILEGRCVACIAKMIENGADLNAKRAHDTLDNAAHVVICSLMEKTQTQTDSLTILNLLVTKGFKLINEYDSFGYTPLHFAMQYADLNEELLTWFHDHGADFNAFKEKDGLSVLGEAIRQQLDPGILRKILEFGADPKYGDKETMNALQLAAVYANKSALEILMDLPDINMEDPDSYNPLDFLFRCDNLDYQPCLELLLDKGVTFQPKYSHGYAPLVAWVKFCNPCTFPTLMNLKDRIPITQEMASDTLTTIVDEIERLQMLLPSLSHEGSNDFTRFVTFLINEKDAELQFREEWKQKSGRILCMKLSRETLQGLCTSGSINYTGESVQFSAKIIKKLDFKTMPGHVFGPVEFTLTCLLAFKKYGNFVDRCLFLRDFVITSESKRKATASRVRLNQSSLG